MSLASNGNLLYHFHQRQYGSAEAPSSRMAESEFVQAISEIVASGTPAGQVMDAVLENNLGQIEVWLRGLQAPGGK